MPSLLDHVLDSSGLPTVIRRQDILRALSRAGVEPGALSPGALRRALDSLYSTLRVYLSEDEARERLEAIAALTADDRSRDHLRR